MTDLARLFTDLLETAMALDIPALRSEILASVDDGLRAANYEGAGGRSADVSSHPERMALSQRQDRTQDDLRRCDSLVASYVTAVGEIAVRSRSGARAETWDGAVKDHNLLDQMDAVGVLERIPGEKPSKWVHRVGDCLHDLELLARRHETGREPDDFERSWTSGLADGDCCRVCLKLRLRTRSHARGLCQGCWKLSQDSRHHTDDGEPIDPPVELIEEFRRIGDGQGPAWKATRSRWLNSLGPERRQRNAG